MAVPGVPLKEIKSVHSHIHALGQCRKIIRKHGWTAMVDGDTAGAAREVAELGDRTRAALAPRIAAGLYGLDILKENVEDEAHNTTRFVILSKKDDPRRRPDNGPVITTFVFRVRNVPAALYKAMGGFATNGVNMTKLESYQLDGKFTATQFYADVEGHPDDRPLSAGARGTGVLLARRSASSASTPRAASGPGWGRPSGDSRQFGRDSLKLYSNPKEAAAAREPHAGTTVSDA